MQDCSKIRGKKIRSRDESVIFLSELMEHLDTTPNYLLGVEDYKGSFTLNALALLKKVDDIKMQTAVLAMLKSWLEA